MNRISQLLRWFHRTSGDGAPSRLPSPDAMVVVARPGGEPEALMMREILNHNGIAAMVKNRDPASAQAGGIGPPWAYELWVLRRDLRRAEELLQFPNDET